MSCMDIFAKGGLNGLSPDIIGASSEDFKSSVVDSESIYKHFSAEDEKIANRLLVKN